MFNTPSEHEKNDGFHARHDPIMDDVDQAYGLIARSGYDDDPGPDSWGEQVYPSMYVDNGDGWAPSTLSVWQDLEAMVAFTFSGRHAEALAKGADWFQRGQWPPLVLWWIEDGIYPTWQDGVSRYEHLHEHGPTPHAFSAKQAFHWTGTVLKLDKAKVKDIMQ